MSANQPIVSIQYLRAAAAIAVVVYHQFQGKAHGLFDLGKYGVDLFFVISGFIMVAMTESRHTTPLDFLKDRIVRIVPLYWTATLLAFLLLLSGAKMFGYFLSSCENHRFLSQSGEDTFWATLGKTWASFHFSIWSHWCSSPLSTPPPGCPYLSVV